MSENQKIRLLHLFGSMNCGGAETMLMNIYRNLDTTDIQFDFLVHSKEKGYYDDEIMARGGKIYYISSQGKLGILRYLLSLKNFLRKEGSFDIVHSHLDWQGGIIALAAYLAGVRKIIVHSHASSWAKPNNVKYRFLLWLQKLFASYCATDFWACSQNAAEFLFHGNFINIRHVQIIPNAIDVDVYMSITDVDRNDMRKKIGAVENTLVIGHVGSIAPVKNQGFLVDIANQLKSRNLNFKMVFVGKGNNEYEQEIKEKIRILHLEDHVIFMGLRNDIAKVMSAFDVFVLPSLSEGLGMVAIEAQASGLPCIVSDGVPKQVDIGLGLVTQLYNRDVKQWSSQIIESLRNGRCLDMQKICNCLSKNGYNVKQSSRQIKKLYFSKALQRG